jgi:hypothetical protein
MTLNKMTLDELTLDEMALDEMTFEQSYGSFTREMDFALTSAFS